VWLVSEAEEADAASEFRTEPERALEEGFLKYEGEIEEEDSEAWDEEEDEDSSRVTWLTADDIELAEGVEIELTEEPPMEEVALIDPEMEEFGTELVFWTKDVSALKSTPVRK